MHLYTVHDKASDTYLPPFSQPTERDAVEGFRYVTNQPETPYSKFPADFTLIYLGSYDTRTAEITLKERKIIINAAALKEQKA